MIIEIEALKKIVEEAEMRKHSHVSIHDNGQVLSKKKKDGYWEEMEL